MSGGEVVALARWLLALVAIGWACYPLLYWATPGLRDRGLTVAKPFALLLLIYPAWFVAALGPPVFAAAALGATLAIVALVGWWLAVTRGGVLPFLRASWRYALAAEALFVAAFLGYAWLRGHTPHIAGTEKPMELGFLTAAARQSGMPPGDPWLSGHAINYYYLGFAIVAALAKLTATPATIAFNLGLATLFAATLVGGTGLVANLLDHAPRVRTLGAGLLGGYLLALAGNMYAARDLLARRRAALDDWWWGGLGWRSSRVVIDSGWPAERYGLPPQPAGTINEFPAFSFLLGDLHAHLIALPFTLLALAFALDVWREPLAARSQVRAHCLARLALAALAIGALYTINSWDLPTYAALYVAALLLPGWLGARRLPTARGGLFAVLFVGLCFALFAPFHARFVLFVGGQPPALPEPWRSVPTLVPLSRVVGFVTWDKTPAGQFLTIYLLPLAVGAAFLARRWWRGRAGGGRAVPLAVGLALVLGAIGLRMPVFALAGVIVALAIAVLARGGHEGGRAGDADSRHAASARFVTLLFGAAFALVLLTEFVFVYDIFNHRVNTVFKVYFQAWTLLAVASGYALARLLDPGALRDLWRRRDGLDGAWWRAPVGGALALLLLASAAYPLVAGRARTREFPAYLGLDGLALIHAAHPEEWAGIAWVRERIPAGAVVAEAPGCSYGDFGNLPHNRVAAFGGVATPLGWAAHEQQWRGGSPELLAELAPRAADLNALYRTTDPGEATRILDRYGIEYVYVGTFERDGYTVGGVGTPCDAGGGYPAAGLAKFSGMLEQVFASEGGRVVIYRRTAR